MNLQELVEKKRLSNAGKDWLLTAVDPFHDFSTVLAGYPDINGNASVVQQYNTSVQISAPTNMVGNTYNARVWLTGLDTHEDVIMKEVSGTISPAKIDYDSDLTLSTIYGSLMTDVWDPTIVPNVNTALGNTPGFIQSRLHNKRVSSAGRVVGMGFEVHNTTAAIERQGTVTCAVMPNIPAKDMSACIDDTATVGLWSNEVTPIGRIQLPPSSLNDAVLLPGSTQWEAAEGVYAISKLVGDNTAQRASDRIFVTTSGGAAIRMTRLTTGSNPGCANEVFSYNNWSRNYALFTGLSAGTTLTVTFKCYYEYFPQPEGTGRDLAPLACPSPPIDYKALKLYSTLCPRLPHAVQVSENPAGEYYRKVLDLIRRVLPTVLPVVTAIHPIAGIAATAANDILQRTKPNPTKKTRKPRPKKPTGWGKGTLQ